MLVTHNNLERWVITHCFPFDFRSICGRNGLSFLRCWSFQPQQVRYLLRMPSWHVSKGQECAGGMVSVWVLSRLHRSSSCRYSTCLSWCFETVFQRSMPQWYVCKRLRNDRLLALSSGARLHAGWFSAEHPMPCLHRG